MGCGGGVGWGMGVKGYVSMVSSRSSSFLFSVIRRLRSESDSSPEGGSGEDMNL